LERVISVVVPVYNVERYLPQCISSILSQDYRNLELILIDDGSTDSSGRICDQAAAEDTRVVVIHQKNSGAAAAKNAGLRAATGTYLSFVDSDDYLEPGAYTYMVRILEENEVDMVQCAFRDVYQDKAIDRILKPGCRMWQTLEYMELYLSDWTSALLWDKLYKRELFHNIFFEVGNKIDDEYFTYQGVMNAKCILSDDKIIYNYRRRASGVMLSASSQERIMRDRIDFVSKRRKKVVARFPELRKKFDRSFTYSMVEYAQMPYNTMESIGMIKRAVWEYMKEKKHTPISVFQWWDILKLLCSKPESILQGIPETQVEEQDGIFFE